MKKAINFLSWFGGILIITVITMLAIGLTYSIPELSLFTDIFKVLFVILVPTALSWVGLMLYKMSNEEL
jgi:hypothetical protein